MMKKIITVTFVSLTTLLGFSQLNFKAPELTDQQKFRIASLNWNSSLLLQISFGKSLGRSVEDIAAFNGDQLKTAWNRQGGYNGFVNSILYTMVSLAPYGTVEITDQNDNRLVYKVTGLYSELREGGSIYGVTWDEYIKFLEITFSKVATYMGTGYSQKDTDEGLIVTVSKI